MRAKLRVSATISAIAPNRNFAITAALVITSPQMLVWECSVRATILRLAYRQTRSTRALFRHFRCCDRGLEGSKSPSGACCDLVDVCEQVRRIGVNTKGACACQFFLAVAA